ncbi:protein disulfide oxidoreductase, partial [Roseburia faecis]|nr:protein disulfide oxidoreductase [Roseburia faecis]
VMGREGQPLFAHNDERGDLAARWQVSVTPSFLIVKDGKVVSTTTGWSSGLGLKLRLAWASLG